MSTSRVVTARKSEEIPGTKEKIPNNNSLFANNSSEMFLKHKRRFCRIESCNRIVKSQGLCQRHGAKPKTCKVEGCNKQAQGNFDKMCKAHFKAMKRQTTPIPKVVNTDTPPPAQGTSVYDDILPTSLTFLPNKSKNGEREYENGKEEWSNTMPLILHLKHGFDTLKPPAWHRNEERRARGMFPIDNPAAQLEGWERELVWMEILVLTGVPGASFRHLARAWGRDKGFHMVLAQFICERFGETERKKRHKEKNSEGRLNNNIKKKRRKTNKVKSKVRGIVNSGGIDDVGADVWDPSLYGDVDTNEALAAEIFDFTEKEFERVVSKYKHGRSSFSSSSQRTSSAGSIANDDITAQAAMTAILGEQVNERGSEEQLYNQHKQEKHYRPEMHRNINQNIIPTPVVVAHPMTSQLQNSEGEVLVHNHRLQDSTAVAANIDVGVYHQQDLHTAPLQGEAYAAPQQINQLIAPSLIQQHSSSQSTGHQSMVPLVKLKSSTIPQTYETAQAQSHPYQLTQHHSSASAQEAVAVTHRLVEVPQHEQPQYQLSHFTMPAIVAQSTQEAQGQALTQQMTRVPCTQQQEQPLAPIATPVHSPPAQMSQAQFIGQQTTYTPPPQQQPQNHDFTSMPAPAPASAQTTQFSQSIEQQLTHVSYSQQEQSPHSIFSKVVNVSYGQQQQQQQQQHDPALSTNPTPQLVAQHTTQQQQLGHIPCPQQQQHQPQHL